MAGQQWTVATPQMFKLMYNEISVRVCIVFSVTYSDSEDDKCRMMPVICIIVFVFAAGH